mmetsp:Transcript_37649/g.79171  ORF Transcript_37649/g.79171 Transcript_37649/m.79171 type:complete len:321 (+) Transcript_37649:403-1365(+)
MRLCVEESACGTGPAALRRTAVRPNHDARLLSTVRSLTRPRGDAGGAAQHLAARAAAAVHESAEWAGPRLARRSVSTFVRAPLCERQSRFARRLGTQQRGRSCARGAVESGHRRLVGREVNHKNGVRRLLLLRRRKGALLHAPRALPLAVGRHGCVRVVDRAASLRGVKRGRRVGRHGVTLRNEAAHICAAAGTGRSARRAHRRVARGACIRAWRRRGRNTRQLYARTRRLHARTRQCEVGRRVALFRLRARLGVGGRQHCCAGGRQRGCAALVSVLRRWLASPVALRVAHGAAHGAARRGPPRPLPTRGPHSACRRGRR